MQAPSLFQIHQALEQLEGRIVATPTLPLTSDRFAGFLPEKSRVQMKMELFQQAGSFKSRGVLLAIDAIDEAQKQAGVTAVSAGNHALAVSWGAQRAGISATVVMPNTADPVRVKGCEALGAKVVLKDTVEAAFIEVTRLEEEEGRTMLHPFESPHMTMGAATCGYEFASAHPNLQTVVIPVGGGGLISGMSSAIKTVLPDCRIIGVEPFGADSMWRSFEKGEAQRLEQVKTIADSLGAPMALPQSFALTRQFTDKIVRLEESEFAPAMQLLFDATKIVAEPACAATLAAIMGPLKSELAGQNIGIIACGSNIGLTRFQSILNA